MSAINGSATTTYTYDANGNRSTRTQGSLTDTYSYDDDNRLVGLTKNTAGGAGTYSYQYDYRTRRITRTESGVTTALVFSGGTSVREYSGSAGGSPVVQYVRGSDYGGGVGGILYTLRGGTPSYTHENRRGDVIAKTGASGSLTYQAQYEGFGNQTQTTGSTLDRQKSNSKDTDPTNLVDEGFRYRDLETGSFITKDPAGFVDGPNEYTYVVDNPWTKFDPEGLDQVSVSQYAAYGAVGGAGVGAAAALPTGEVADLVTVPVGAGIGYLGGAAVAGVHNTLDLIHTAIEGHSGSAPTVAPPPSTGGSTTSSAPASDKNPVAAAPGNAPPPPEGISVPPAPKPTQGSAPGAQSAKVTWEIKDNFAPGSKESQQLHEFVDAWNKEIQDNGGSMTTRTTTDAEDAAAAKWQSEIRTNDPATYPKGGRTVVGHVPDAAAGGPSSGGTSMALDKSVNSSIGGQVGAKGPGYTYNEVKVVPGDKVLNPPK